MSKDTPEFEVMNLNTECFICKKKFEVGDKVLIFHRPWKFRWGKDKKRADRRFKGDHSDGLLVHRGCYREEMN